VPSMMPSNMMFISDFAFHQHIRSAVAEVVKAHARLKLQCEAAIHRMAYARSHLQEATEFLQRQREELDSVRGKIFTQIVSLRSNIPTDNPPPYEEAASRETDTGDAGSSSQSSEEASQLADSLRQSLVLAGSGNSSEAD